MILGAEGAAAAALAATLVLMIYLGLLATGAILVFLAATQQGWTRSRRRRFGIIGGTLLILMIGGYLLTWVPLPIREFDFAFGERSSVDAVSWGPEDERVHTEVRCRCTVRLKRANDDSSPPLEIALASLSFAREGSEIVRILGGIDGLGFDEMIERGSKINDAFDLGAEHFEHWRQRKLESPLGTAAYDRSNHIEGANVSLRITGSRPENDSFYLQVSVDWIDYAARNAR